MLSAVALVAASAKNSTSPPYPYISSSGCLYEKKKNAVSIIRLRSIRKRGETHFLTQRYIATIATILQAANAVAKGKPIGYLGLSLVLQARRGIVAWPTSE